MLTSFLLLFFLKKALKCLLKATVFWVPTRPEGETKSSATALSPEGSELGGSAVFCLLWGLCISQHCLDPSFPFVLGESLHCCFPGVSVGKESIYQSRRPGFYPWIWKILQRKKWQPTPVFLPDKSHRQRNLMGYSLGGHKSLTGLSS